MPDRKISELPAGGDPQDDDAFVVARGATNVSLAWSSLSNAATQNNVALTIGGNTAGAGALVSTGTLTLAGGNNITLSQNGNAVTISGGAGGGATFSGGMSTMGNTSGDTGYASNRLNLVGGNNITLSGSTNGGSMTITVSGANVGGAQTGISGLANSEATYTSGTVELVGTGAITIASDAGQQFVFSVDPQSVQPETQTFIGGISASDALFTSGTVRLTGVGGGITVGTNTGQRIDLSVAAQSVQPETQTFIAGISASNTLYTSGNVRFTGSQAVTVRSGTGQLVVIDAPAQTAQTGISGIANSQTTYTSGTVTLDDGPNITVLSNGGNHFQFSVPDGATATGNIGAITVPGSSFTSGTVLISGSGAVTVTHGAEQEIFISVNPQTVQTQGVLNVALSNVGNTSGNTGVNSGTRYVLAGGNGITLSGSTAANATTVTISGITQSVQTQDVLSVGVSTGGNTSGNTTVNTGSRFVIVGSNGITASQGTAAGATTVTLSGITQSVQTQDVLSIGVSTGGNTAGNTTVNTGSRFVIVGSNGITASAGTAAGATTVTLSGITQSVQTNDIPRLGVSTGGNTAGDTTVNSGTRFVLVGSNMVSLSQATAASATTVTINATQTAQTQGIINAGVSTGGNTSGDTTVNSGTRLVFVGSNNITLSQGTAANATTITISGPTAGAFSGGMSTQGNTAGDTGYASQRLNLVGSNNITLSGSTNGGSMTVSLFGPTPGAAQFSVGVSTGGNTAGATGVSGTRIVHVGSGAITLSQTTDATGITITHTVPATSSLSATGAVSISTNGSTISIGAPHPTLSEWRNFAGVGTAAGGVGLTYAPINASSRSLVVAPLGINDPGRLFPGQMTVSSLYIGPFSQSDSTATMSQANTVSVSIGIYTLSGSTLNLLNSVSTSWGNAANVNNSTSTVGVRWLSFHSSQWSSNPVFSNGHYWIATLFNTAGIQITRTQSMYGGSWIATTAYSGTMGVATANNTTMGYEPFYGLYSATTTGMPAAISSNHLNKQTAAAAFFPQILFNNINNSF